MFSKQKKGQFFMADFKQVFADEIRRLARKEIKVAMAAVTISRSRLQMIAYHGWHTDFVANQHIFRRKTIWIPSLVLLPFP